MGSRRCHPYGHCMTTLHIEHAIIGFDTWRAAFEGFATVRREAGVVAERVARPVDDPHYIVIGLDFDTTEQATAFLHFLETQVWASPTSAPALDGRPRTVILEPV